MERKEILCYGDSNTWGVIPRWQDSDIPSSRYDENTRWTKVAGKLLGEDYHLIEEGLGGRTTIYDVPGEPWKNGKTYLKPCLMTHRQLDLVVLMLGSNDLHLPGKMDEEHLGDGIRELIELIQDTPKCGRGFTAPGILVMAPAEIRPSAPNGRVSVYPRFYGDWGRKLSLDFPKVYEKIAGEYGCYFLNAAMYAEPGPGDGIHFTPESHVRLGRAVAEKIREIFGEATGICPYCS